MKILVVDDDRDLRDLIGFALRRASYLVIEAADGAAALASLGREEPALVILDVNLPDTSGFELLRAIRAQGETPVMLLTVRSSEEDQVLGLDLGADDYLTKPFSPRTLLARVRALLRRAGVERPALQERGPLALDGDCQEVRVSDGPPVRLTNLEFRLLQYLLANAGRTMAYDQLVSHVWGYQSAGDRQALKQLVHRLRQKLEPSPAQPRLIVAVAGVGYTLRL
jgi:DNA-binding response OmpR family regulator